jgi:vacuolar-type H+-ATPase subunit F/Vma7
MDYHVAVLARPEVTAGFALAGLRPVAVATADEAAARLRDQLASPEAGVVLLEDAAYARLGDDLRRRIARHALPMVVPFPGPAWGPAAAGPEAYIVELLRHVIGYRVRLK